MKKKLVFRFYEELNNFSPSGERKWARVYFFKGPPLVKDATEAQNVLYTEVHLILINQQPASFTHRLPHDRSDNYRTRQTTTDLGSLFLLFSCSLFQFLIKPQQGYCSFALKVSCSLFQFLIKPQLHHQHYLNVCCCSLFQFLIKPQLSVSAGSPPVRCSLFQFLIKPQRNLI